VKKRGARTQRLESGEFILVYLILFYFFYTASQILKEAHPHGIIGIEFFRN